MRSSLLVLAALLTAANGCRCECGNGPDADADGGRPDAGDTDRDVANDARPDADGDGHDADSSDGDQDRDHDVFRPDTGTTEELCGGSASEWDWQPFECPEIDSPDDCCASCRRLTCRELAGAFYDIWENRVVYQTRASVAMKELDTGRDEIVFSSRVEGQFSFSYTLATVSSQFVAARRSSSDGETIMGRAVVALNLSNLSGPEITVDDSVQNGIFSIDLYDQWLISRRRPASSEGTQLVLYDIETGQQWILEDEALVRYEMLGAKIWGDRVVWATSEGALKEYRISTGVTREVIRDFSLYPMYYVSIWENYAVFTHEPYDAPWTVYLVDLDAGTVRPISPTDSTQDESVIHGGRVVWTDYRGGGSGPGGMHIYVYSIATGREYPLNLSARGGSTPRIFDRTIVWGGGPEPEGIWVTRIADI
jgi:hypothetical protein